MVRAFPKDKQFRVIIVFWERTSWSELFLRINNMCNCVIIVFWERTSWSELFLKINNMCNCVIIVFWRSFEVNIMRDCGYTCSVVKGMIFKHVLLQLL